MNQKKPCHCSGEFDAQIAYKRLSEKYNQLAELIADHLSPSESAGLERGMEVQMDMTGTAGGPKPELDPSIAELVMRIIGGKKVSHGGYPECCLVGRRNQNGTLEWFCTGVLVHPRIVLTAAHCHNPANAYIVGLNTVSQNELSQAELIVVKKAVPHLGYQQTGKLYDICVLVLAENAKTAPVPMATTAEINASSATTLVGFGNDDVYSTVGFGLKREVTVNIQSIRRATTDNLDAFEIQYDYESDLEFVAGGKGYDSCNGDSGGPAYIEINGVRKVAGLTSRATRGAQTPCGDGGIYTRVDVHQDFITGLIPA